MIRWTCDARRVLRRCLAIVAAVCTVAIGTTAARASGDMGCAPAWRLKHADLTGCDSMAMLTPGNDTRVNLMLLLRRGGWPAPSDPSQPSPAPLFDWGTLARTIDPAPADVGSLAHAVGEGSRCRSDEAGAAAFAAAVSAARKLDGTERTALIAARAGLKPDCTGPGGATAALAAADVAARSAAARDFAAYLHGAAAFYAGDFDGAIGRFTALARAGDPWLRETAAYMLARVELNRAQVGAYDEYGYRDEKVPLDARAIAAAETGLLRYLKAYPRGRYATSAHGLLRRAYWLGGDTRKLAAAYAALLAQPAASRGIGDVALVQEIDNKLLPRLTAADTSDPALLAVIDLLAMRRSSYEGGATPTMTRSALEAQRAAFARNPALFDFVLAAQAFYVEGNAREVLRLIADRATGDEADSVGFSRRMLRGMALDATGDAASRPAWLAMLSRAGTPFRRVTVELALALHDERTGGLERVFAPGSPVQDVRLRDRLLVNVAGADLLRRRAHAADATAHERAIALFTLLYKEVTRGGHAAFVTDVAAVPPGAAKDSSTLDLDGGEPPLGIFTGGAVAEGFPCPALVDTARRLADAPAAATPRLCLAEWVRLNNLDDFTLDTQPPRDELGGTPSQFGGAPFSRLAVYQAVIAAPASTASERAYALYRAVRCYAPSGNNACGGDGVPQSTRRAWFQRLHRDYAASRWARELEYYW